MSTARRRRGAWPSSTDTERTDSMHEELTTEAMDAAPAGALIIWETMPNDLRPIAMKVTDFPDPLARWVDQDGDRMTASELLGAWVPTVFEHQFWLYTAPLFTPWEG